MNKIQTWAYGLLGGIIGGGATTASAWLGMSAAHAAGMNVPELNLKALGVIFVSGMLSSGLSYLKQSPLPPISETTTITVTETKTPSDTTTTKG